MVHDTWYLTPDTKHRTPDTWHLTPDTGHVTCDMWHKVGGEHSLKTSASWPLWFGIDSFLKILNERISYWINESQKHSFMVPANSWLWSSSWNIKEFLRDYGFSHSKMVLFTPQNHFSIKQKKKQVITNYQTKLFKFIIRLHNVSKKWFIAKTNKTESDFNRWTPPA